MKIKHLIFVITVFLVSACGGSGGDAADSQGQLAQDLTPTSSDGNCATGESLTILADQSKDSHDELGEDNPEEETARVFKIVERAEKLGLRIYKVFKTEKGDTFIVACGATLINDNDVITTNTTTNIANTDNNS